MRIERLSEIGGVSVDGVDPAERQAPDVKKQLKTLYDQQGFIAFSDKKLAKRQPVGAGETFGGTMINAPAVSKNHEVPRCAIYSTRSPTLGRVSPKAAA